VENGWTAIQTMLHTNNLAGPNILKQFAEMFHLVREVVGDEIDILLNFRGCVTPQMAI
jgi:hypothetical protein